MAGLLKGTKKVKGKKKPKASGETISTLKKLADGYFSEFIRQRDEGVCVTCGDVKYWRYQQNGHYETRGNIVTRYDEKNNHCQCLTSESNLMLTSLERVSISEIKVGDKVFGFDDKTFEKLVCIVEDVNSFIPSKLYEIELEDGNKFYATGDHKIVVDKEWKEIKDITKGNIMEIQ